MGRLLITTHDCYSTREADETASLRVATPRAVANDEDKPTSGTLTHTAFRLSGIRARDDAAESDEAMASNDNKKKARRLQQENPGMKYTEALRRVEAETGRILIGRSLEGGTPVFLDPRAPRHEVRGIPREKSVAKALEGLKPAESQEKVILDEWHELRPSGEYRAMIDGMIRRSRAPRPVMQSLSDIIDRLDSGGREPWPLYVGDDLSDWTPLALFPLENDGNLAVCGPSGAGHTATLRALARSALGEGWAVSIVGTKADEFRDLRERHPQRVTTLPGGRFVSEEEGRAFVEGMTPGTAREPRLVIIDNGDYLFDSATGSRGEEWVDALENLMAHPHTAVVLQSTFLDRRRIPAQIIRHLNSRLLLGHSPEQMQRNVFRDVVPPDSFDAFDFNQPAWTGTIADRGRGVLWDGERLVRILHDPLDLQGGRA